MIRRAVGGGVRIAMQLTPVGGICALIFWLMLAFGLSARAEPRLYCQETKHFRIIYYSPQHEYLAPLLIRSLENALIFYKKNFGYEPKGKITILIQDFDDSGYGGAGTVPIDFIQIGIEPFNLVFETLPSAERMGLMSKHEMMHIVMGDEMAPRDEEFRAIFCREDYAEHRRSGIDSLQLSWEALECTRRAGFMRARQCSWKRGWVEGLGERSADTTRWSSARWSVTIVICTTWWGSSLKEPPLISRWARIPICTALAS